jgi:hypothetical protein
MMEFVLMGVLTGLAWVHARLTVISAIHKTTTPDQMLRRICVNTYWMVLVVVLCYYALGEWGSWIVLFALARSMFLLFTSWHVVCDNYQDIKRLLLES